MNLISFTYMKIVENLAKKIKIPITKLLKTQHIIFFFLGIWPLAIQPTTDRKLFTPANLLRYKRRKK